MTSVKRIIQKAFGFSVLILVMPLCVKSVVAAELVMFNSFNCSWCKSWEEEVGIIYHQTPQGIRFPIRRLNVDNRSAWGIKVPIVYTPTFILLKEGEEVGRITGYPGEEHFWALLDQLLKKISEPETYRCSNVKDKITQIGELSEKRLC